MLSGLKKQIDLVASQPVKVDGRTVVKKRKKLPWKFIRKTFSLIPGCRKVVSSANQFLKMTLFRGVCITVSPHVWTGVHIGLYIRRIILQRSLIQNIFSRELLLQCATSSVGVMDLGLAFGRLVLPKHTRALVYDSRAVAIVLHYLMKKVYIAYLPNTRRSQAWVKQHAWGVQKMDSLIHDFGGFFLKIGQIMGTATHLMPPAFVECFTRTMDKHKPLSIAKVTQKINRELGENGTVKDVYEEFSSIPAATASIAQVHFGRLRDGRPVASKLMICNKDKMIGDVQNMHRTSRLLKWCRMDGGVDLPTIMSAYMEVIEEEFDFEQEAQTMMDFTDMMRDAGLSDRIAIPGLVPHLSTKRLLVMERLPGDKLVDVLTRTRRTSATQALQQQEGGGGGQQQDQSRVVPPCPPRVAWKHLPVWQTSPGLTAPLGGNPWEGVFHTLQRAWGQMILKYGRFHSDPHPGNLLLLPDGRIGLIDFGQKKTLRDEDRLWLCRLVLAMSSEDYPLVADLIRGRDKIDFEIEDPTQEALNMLAYTFYDTRWTPLASINMFDFNNSPLIKNRVVRNSQEGFMVARVVCLLRGLMKSFGVEASVVKVWEPIARQALIDAGEQPPSAASVQVKRGISQAKVTYGLLNGNRQMAENDMRRGTSPRPQVAPWDFVSSN